MKNEIRYGSSEIVSDLHYNHFVAKLVGVCSNVSCGSGGQTDDVSKGQSSKNVKVANCPVLYLYILYILC